MEPCMVLSIVCAHICRLGFIFKHTQSPSRVHSHQQRAHALSCNSDITCVQLCQLSNKRVQNGSQAASVRLKSQPVVAARSCNKLQYWSNQQLRWAGFPAATGQSNVYDERRDETHMHMLTQGPGKVVNVYDPCLNMTNVLGYGKRVVPALI